MASMARLTRAARAPMGRMVVSARASSSAAAGSTPAGERENKGKEPGAAAGGAGGGGGGDNIHHSFWWLPDPSTGVWVPEGQKLYTHPFSSVHEPHHPWFREDVHLPS